MCTKCSPTLEYMHFLFRRLQEFIWSPFVYIAGHLCIYLSVSHSAVLPVQFCGQLIHHYCRLGRASTWEHPVMRHTHTCCQPLMNTFFTTMLLHYAQPHVLSFPLCPITVSCCPTTVGKKKECGVQEYTRERTERYPARSSNGIKFFLTWIERTYLS